MLNITTVVPVPAAVWLFGSALGVVGAQRNVGHNPWRMTLVARQPVAAA